MFFCLVPLFALYIAHADDGFPAPTMHYDFNDRSATDLELREAKDRLGNGPVFSAQRSASLTTNTGVGGSGGAEMGTDGWFEAESRPLFQFTEEFTIGFSIKVKTTTREHVCIEQYKEISDSEKKGWTITMLGGKKRDREPDGAIRIDGNKSVGVTAGENYQEGKSKPDKMSGAVMVADDGEFHKILVMRRSTPGRKGHFDTLIWVDGKLSGRRPAEDDDFVRLDRQILIGKGIRRESGGAAVSSDIISAGLTFDELYVWHNRALSDEHVAQWFSKTP